MRTRDLQLLIDLEIIDPRSHQDEAFFVWCKLLDDPILRQLVQERHNVKALLRDDKTWWHAPQEQLDQDLYDAVAAMTNVERLVLAERVRLAYADFWKPAKVA